MPEIKIKVRDKCAEGKGVVICNNSDYTVMWDLDEEWTPYDTKTMRVNLADGTYQDVVFTGDNAALPVLTASGWVSVGLYAGDLHTSRAARLLALSSVLTPGGSPAAPAEDVYAQIMAKLNELSTVSPEDIAKAVEDYLAEHPAASASMRVEGGYIQFSGDGKTWENVIALADLKGPKGDTGATGPQGPAGAGMDITGATVGQIAKIAAVDASGVPTAWSPVDMPTGADGTSSGFRVLNASIDIGGTARADISTADSGQSYADLDIQEFVMEAVIRGNPDLTTSQRVVFAALSGSISEEVGLLNSALLTKNGDFRCFMVHARKIMGQTWQIRIAGSASASMYFKASIMADSMFSSDLTGMRIVGGFGAVAFGEGSTVRVWGK